MANYIDNNDLLTEVLASKSAGKLTPKAIEQFILMVYEIGLEFRYKNPTDKQDCASEAMLNVLKYWNRFDETISTNAFSYFTQIIKNAYGIGYNRLFPKKLKTVSISINDQAINF